MVNQRSLLRVDRTTPEDLAALAAEEGADWPLGRPHSVRYRRAFERRFDDRHDAAKIALGWTYDDGPEP